jgi:biotin transporter BioY
MNAYGSDLLAATNGMLPYLAWDFVKAVIAAGVIPGAWLLVNKLKK